MNTSRSIAGKQSWAKQALTLLAAAPLLVLPPHALALPTGGQVVAGDVSITSAGARMDITQLGRAGIVDWADFGIGAGGVVNIHQAADAALLNRVVGANPSQLLGQLNAAGRVYLINPNGVLVGADARIDAGSFFATTAQIGDAAFLAGGDLAFSGGTEAGIVNLGVIRATAGDAVLVAHRVVNAGEIHAPAGVAALGAATEFIYSPLGDQRMRIVTSAAGEAPAGGTGVDNSGLVNAAEARLQAANGNLYELAVNQTGIVRATGIETRGGRVLLTATGGTVAVTGNITARNADGSGGEVLVGGDFQGANAAVPNVAFTRVGAEAVIDVAATSATGDGGRAIVWADDQTDFAGRIFGQGGARGGDGAFAEVSGKRILNYRGLADLSAPFGSTGTLWLDPDEAIISAAADDQANGIFNNTVLSNNLATANVIVDASGFGDGDGFKIGDITVNAPVTWTSGNTLTLKAGNRVVVNANLSGGTGQVIFQAMGVSLGNTIAVDAAATITAASLTIGQNPDAQFVGFNPLPESHRNLRGINIAGVLNVGTLDIRTENAGIAGDITIANPANSIGTLASSATAGTINGNIVVVGGAGDLTLTGNFAAVAAGKSTTLSTGGALTLAPGAAVASGANANVVLAAGTGAFTNNAGTGAITVGAGGRSLIYSNNPGATTLGGLVATPVYNKTFAANAPGTITQTGNRVLYSLAPTITFTASNLQRVYGVGNPALTFAASGLVGADTAAQAFTGAPVLSTTATAASNAGDHAIAVGAGTVVASDYDYQIAFAPGLLTVNPAPLTITAENKAKTQGDANPALTATFSGLVNGDAASAVVGLVLATTAEIASPAGNFPITASGATSPNYAISFVNGVLTVNSLPALIITANSFDIRYGAPLPTFTASITGFGGGDDASIVSGLTLTTNALAGSPIGSYTISPGNATATGYEISYVNGTLRIDPALLTITANSLNRFYGAVNPALGVSYAGFVSGEDASLVTGLTLATAATDASNVGDYIITPAGATALNYTITFAPGTLTIDRAPLAINVDNLTKVFGDPNPTLTASAIGLVLNQTLASLGTFILATAGTETTAVGNVAITASLTGAGANNYTTTITPGSLSITPRPVTARLSGGSRAYGDANPTITLAFVGTNPVGTTNFFVDNITLGATSTTATPSSDVGVYPTTVTDMSAANPNFAFTVEEGSITVTPAPLTVRANNAARLYGAANPAFTSTVTGLKLTDTLADVLSAAAVATAAGLTSNVGGYAITASGTARTNNYAITFTPGTLTVNKAPLFVVPALSSRLYGDPDPTFAITATGLLNGDTAAVVTQRIFSGSAPTAGFGSQPITILGATATNYALTFGLGTLNILPRPLTITALSFTREYGEANPAFTFSFSNLASFDTPAVIPNVAVSTSATAASSVVAGGYAISPTSGANPNYAITYAPGTLMVTPAPLVFGSGSFSRIYGQASPAIGADLVTGLKLTDTPDLLGVTVVGPAATANVGTHPITISLTNPNYTVPNASGEMQVLPAPIGVNIGNVVRRYGDPNPAASAVPLTVSGLAFGQTALEVISLDFGVDARAVVGNYPIAPTLISPNYHISSLSFGNLAVLVRPIELRPVDIVRLFGDPNPPLQIVVGGAGLASFDTLADVAFSDRIQVGSTVVDGLPGLLTGAGLRQLQVVLTGNPNYEVRRSPGVFAVLPRPVTLEVGNVSEIRPIGSPPVTPEQLRDLDFTITAEGLLAGDSLDSLFPGLDLRIFNETSTTVTTLHPDYLATFVPPRAEDLGPGADLTISLPTQTTTVQFTPAPPAGFFLVLTAPVYFGVVPTGATVSSNGNYVVTRLVPGRIAVQTRTRTLEDFALSSSQQNSLPQSQPLVVVSQRDDRNNVGLVFADNPAMGVDMITRHFASLFASGEAGEDALVAAIFGEGVSGSDDIDPATITAWLSDIGTNAEKRLLMGGALANFVIGLRNKDAATLSAGEQRLVETLNVEMAAQRAEMLAELGGKLEAWQAGQSGTQLANVFGTDVPYQDFLSEFVTEKVEDFAAKAALVTGGSAAGVAAGVAAGAIASSMASTIFPFAATAALKAGATAAAAAGAGATKAFLGPFALIVVAVEVSIVRAIQIGEEVKAKNEFDAVMDPSNSSTLSNMKLDSSDESLASSIDRLVLMNALTAMLGAG